MDVKQRTSEYVDGPLPMLPCSSYDFATFRHYNFEVRNLRSSGLYNDMTAHGQTSPVMDSNQAGSDFKLSLMVGLPSPWAVTSLYSPLDWLFAASNIGIQQPEKWKI